MPIYSTGGGGGGEAPVQSKEVTLSGLAGNTVTEADWFEQGMTVLAVRAVVDSVITGCASFDIGDAMDPQAYHTGVGLAEGSVADESTQTQATERTINADRDLVLTAVGAGANFTGGDVTVKMYYQEFATP